MFGKVRRGNASVNGGILPLCQGSSVDLLEFQPSRPLSAQRRSSPQSALSNCFPDDDGQSLSRSGARYCWR